MGNLAWNCPETFGDSGLHVLSQVWECLNLAVRIQWITMVQLQSWQFEAQILAKLEIYVSHSKELVRRMQRSAASWSVRTEKQSDVSQDTVWYNSSVRTQGAETTRNGLVGISGLVVCYYWFELVSVIFHLSSLYDDTFFSQCIHYKKLSWEICT